MSLVARYIMKQYMAVFFGTLALFYTVYMVIYCTEAVPVILKHSGKLTAWETVLYFILDFPMLGIFFTPISGLFATVFVLSKLNSQNESIAIFNAGVSIIYIIRPILIFATAVCFLYYYYEDEFLFGNHLKQRAIHNKMVNRLSMDKWNIYDLTAFGNNNKVYFIGKISPSEGRMYDTQVIYLADDQKHIKELLAFTEGYYNERLELWHLLGVVKRVWVGRELKTFEAMGIIDLKLDETPSDFMLPPESAIHLSAKQLKAEAERKKRIGDEYLSEQADVYYRYGSYFFFLFTLILGVPVSSISRNANFVMSLLVVLIIIVFYFFFAYVGNSLGREGIIPAMLSGWLANIASLFVSLYYWKAKRLI